MKKLLITLLLLAVLVFAAACGSDDPVTTTEAAAGTTTPAATTTTAATTTQPEVTTNMVESIKALRAEVWQEYVDSLPESRATELVKNDISYVTVNNIKMKVNTKVYGTKPEDGYPIFIVLHGGGTDPTGEMNESQWAGMHLRYANRLNCPGIFVSCRAIEDTWNCHSVDNAYMFYDRIIEDAVIYMDGNPNKAYVVGYSAGGDGVYQIAPRMADRFAAANMTAGHPNGISMINTYNLPFYLQVGELDTAYNRNTETVKYGNKLEELAETYGGGYLHEVFVHVNKEHGVVGDNALQAQGVVDDLDAWLAAGGRSGVGGTKSAMTHAGLLMSANTRNPLPERVIWDFTTRTPNVRGINSFYWVSAPASIRNGVLDISYNKETNTVSVASCSVKGTNATKITVYLSEDMLDLSKEITFDFCGTQTTFTAVLSEETLRETTAERGDPNYQFISSFTFDLSGNVTP